MLRTILMDELAKLKRVLQKKEPLAPQHSWLVVDGSTGTNGFVSSKKYFMKSFGPQRSGRKPNWDGTSKRRGPLVSIYRELGIPIFLSWTRRTA